MSITPHQLNLLTSPVVELYQALEVEILKQIARRMRVTGEATITEYQLKKLSQLHLLNRDIADTLSEMSGIATERIKSAIHEAGYRMNEDTDEYMRKAGKELLPTPPIEPLMESYVKQTFREINNFVNQTLIDTHLGRGTVSKMYEQMVTESVAKVASGLMTLEQAVENTVIRWAEKGVPSTFIDKGGHTWSMERYVRTVLKSTNSRIYNELRTSRMGEYGVYTVLVSSKPKARPACAHCQGKVIDIRPIGEADSEYPSAYEFGYGEPGGHRGVNCGHSWFPFIPGVNTNNQVQYDPKKAIEAEKVEQQRKDLARRIVKTKKLLTVTKELNSEGAKIYSDELRRLQSRMAEFVKKHGLKRDYNLEKVYTPKEILMKDIDKDAIIKVDKVIVGRKPPGIYEEPNIVVEHHGISGQVLARAYYDDYGMKERELHFTDHGRPDKHPFGSKGEHIHDYQYDKQGKVISRKARELTQYERKENMDILWDYLRKN